MKNSLSILTRCSVVAVMLLASFTTNSQSKLDSIFELSKNCARVKKTYELEPTTDKSNYEINHYISDEGLLIMSLENYSTDTLEIENDCGLFHFFVEFKQNDSIITQNVWCDYIEFRKYLLTPNKGIKSCFGIISEDWVGKKIRVGILANKKKLFSEWTEIK